MSYCKSYKRVPDVGARAICDLPNAPHRVKIAADGTALAAVYSSRAVGLKTLEALRKGITNFPIDLDPRIAALITARVIATAAVVTAQAAVAAADVANTLLPLGLRAVSGDNFALEQGDLYGRFPQVTKGEPMVFDIQYKLAGKSTRDRMAFSSIDAAFNTRQMEVIALGIAVDSIVAAGSKLTPVPYVLLDLVEDVYTQKKNSADKELNEVINKNPLIPNFREGRPTMMASLSKGREDRAKEQKEAIEARRRAEDKARALQNKDSFEALAEAKVQKQIDDLKKQWGAGAGGSQNFTAPQLSAALKAALVQKVLAELKAKAAREAKSVNLAKGKPATQSSEAAGGKPQRAVDGNRNQNYGARSVTHTRTENMPWWEVDLGAVYKVNKIRIYNRSDCCSARILGANVIMSDQPIPKGDGRKAKSKKVIPLKRTQPVYTLKAGDIPVRYVRVQLPKRGVLSMAEIEVLGDPKPLPVAKKKDVLPQQGFRLAIKTSGKCLSGTPRSAKGDQAIVYSCLVHRNQTFKAVYKGDSFQLINQMSKLCLAVAGGDRKPGAKIIAWPCSNDAHFLWRKVDVGGGWFQVVSQRSGHCLNLAGGSKANFTPIVQWHCTKNNPSVLFRLQ